MKTLNPLNTSTFFCSECGMAERPADGTDCPVCLSMTKAAWSVKDPLPLRVHIAIALAIGMAIIGIAAALRV